MNNFSFKQFISVFKNFTIVILFFILAYACNNPLPEECPYQYQGDTAFETISRMIMAEADAANNETISIIRSIFAPDAHIVNERDGTEWNDPISHYLELFESFDFTEALNFDIKTFGDGITADTAYIVSSNSGIYTMNGGEPVAYNNTDPKDTWILKKNGDGCWVITEYRYY